VPLRTLTRPTREAGTLIAGEGGSEREGYQPHHHVALMLPISGSLAPLGRAVRDGFFTAYFAERGPKPEVKIYDTGDSVEGAINAVKRADKDGAERMVGPLAREQVAALYERDVLDLPSLALNFPDSGLAPPRGSQQFGLPPDEEAALAAQRALDRGFRQVALIAQREDWAERAALAFRAQFEHGGGTIAGEGRIGDVDLARALDEALGRHKVDAVFIAVKPNAARILVPQLRARGMTDTPILAISQIYGGSPSRGLDRDLDGVEFCDAPWLHGLSTGLPERDQVGRYLAGAESNPRLFAFGMDAFRLLPYLDWLTRNPDAFINGASGQLSMDSFGRVRRGLAWLRFDGGVPRAADGALTPQGGP
jgi:outer membrane PBP1 activator LpoA protein